MCVHNLIIVSIDVRQSTVEASRVICGRISGRAV